jgi:hypothetical protein
VHPRLEDINAVSVQCGYKEIADVFVQKGREDVVLPEGFSVDNRHISLFAVSLICRTEADVGRVAFAVCRRYCARLSEER